jgi:hypothetical protein
MEDGRPDRPPVQRRAGDARPAQPPVGRRLYSEKEFL